MARKGCGALLTLGNEYIFVATGSFIIITVLSSEVKELRINTFVIFLLIRSRHYPKMFVMAFLMDWLTSLEWMLI